MATNSRVITLFASATALVLTLSACGASPESSSTASAGDSLKVGSDLTYPPYAYLDGDTPAGFEADLWALLAPELGVEYTMQDTRFEQLIPGLNANHFDVVSSALYITAERAKQVDYIPYFATGNSIVSKADGSHQPESVLDLCELKVGVIKGSDIFTQLTVEGASLCEAAGKGPIIVSDFPTDPEATQALLAGQMNAQVTDAAVAANVIEMQPSLKITSSELLYPIPVGMAVVKGNDELRERIEKGLDALRKSGAYQQLLDQYNLSEPTQEQLDAALDR